MKYEILSLLVFIILALILGITMLCMSIKQKKYYHYYFQKLIIYRQKFDNRFNKVFINQDNMYQYAKPESISTINTYRYDLVEQISILNDELITLHHLITKGYIFKTHLFIRHLHKQFTNFEKNVKIFNNDLNHFWSSFDENDDCLVNYITSNKQLDSFYMDFCRKYDLDNSNYNKAAQKIEEFIVQLELLKKNGHFDKKQEKFINKQINSIWKNKVHLIRNLVYFISLNEDLEHKSKLLNNYLLQTFQHPVLDEYFMLANEWTIIKQKNFKTYLNNSQFNIVYEKYLFNLEQKLNFLIPLAYQHHQTQHTYQELKNDMNNALNIVQHLLTDLQSEVKTYQIQLSSIHYDELISQLNLIGNECQRLINISHETLLIQDYNTLQKLKHLFINVLSCINHLDQWKQLMQTYNDHLQKIEYFVRKNIYNINQILALKNKQLIILEYDQQYLNEYYQQLLDKNFSFLTNSHEVLYNLTIIDQRINKTMEYANLIMQKIPEWMNVCQNYLDENKLVYKLINNPSSKEQITYINDYLDQITLFESKNYPNSSKNNLQTK
ncbi:hypothetical protein OF377_00150 [Ureaplasma sp. ES3154-GEN]|uniref:hypothetical protein n=1 Tax=Ureaplasma sp. ES3154-GEN TaxID=2984844 RepID=UPI0021E94E54|nr:hypothetical protein [Ureaplasma sp. ES3154-GEN]MCV3743299.1 hypothetical protein [Ureaplasma sp. ES3154-GEN]